MNTFVTSLQFVVLVLCLYGELTRRIKSTFPVTVALGTIFVSTLVSMSKSFSQRGLDDALFWAGCAAAVAWIIRELVQMDAYSSRHDRGRRDLQ